MDSDENSEYYHAILKKKRRQMGIKGVMIEGEWINDHERVKDQFFFFNFQRKILIS